MFYTRLMSRVALATATVALTGLPVMAELKIEPRPSVVLGEVRGKLPAQFSTLIDIEKVGNKLIAVGDYGHVLMSTDGKSWQQVKAPHNAMLNAVEFVDAKNGWAIGHDNVVMRTTDGGSTWKIQYFDANDSLPLYGTHFDDAQKGFVVGARGTVLTTKDGGNSWAQQETFLLDLGMHANNITRLNDGTLVITGERSILMRSTDDGETWELIKSPYSGTWFGAVPVGEKGALFYGLRGNIYVTDDFAARESEDPEEWDEFGVETITDADELAEIGWRKLATKADTSFFNGIRLDDGRIALVGVAGAAYVVDEGATSARLVNNPRRLDLGGVAEFGGKLYAVGYDGIHILQP